MKVWLSLIIVLLVSYTDPVTKIAKANKLKKEASEAYDTQDYAAAVNAYSLLIDSLETNDNKARLNLANAAYLISYGGDNMDLLKGISSGQTQVQDSTQLSSISKDLQYFDIAEKNYRVVKDGPDNSLASLASNQLGIISYKMGEQSPDEKESFNQSALSNFKNALIRNPNNDQARYNYELLKKLIRQQEQQEQEQQQQDQQNQDKENQDQEKKDQQQQDQENQNQDQKEQQEQEQKQDQQQQQNQEQQQDQEQSEQQNQEQQEGEEQKDPMEKLMEKLKEMNIPLEKAQMILEAMKNNEIQYVQQKKKKASKRKDKSKPDW